MLKPWFVSGIRILKNIVVIAEHTENGTWMYPARNVEKVVNGLRMRFTRHMAVIAVFAARRPVGPC